MKTKTGVQVFGFVVLVAAPSIAGCGGGGGSCGVTPCGGDVVGAWQASSSCVNRAILNEDFMASFAAICTGVNVSSATVTPTGSVTFGADMTYSGTFALATSATINFPTSCLMGMTCAALDATLQGAVGTDGIQSITCTGGNGPCTCTLMQSLTDLLPNPGTYVTAGTELTLTGADASMESGPYCVQGSSLHLVDVEMGGMMRIASDIVFSKQ